MKKQIAILSILFLTFLVWAPTLSTYFSQDDWVFLSHVYKQPFLAVWEHYPEAFYRPVGQQLFFFLGSNLFGLESQGFHLIGLAIHLFNIWLLSKLLNIFTHDRSVKYFLLIFYAVNPVHFVALNWLTQIDLEIAVSFGLTTIYLLRSNLGVRQGWTFRLAFSLILFLLGLLSHEIIVMLPAAMTIWRFKEFKGQSLRTQGLSLIKPAVFFSLGVLILVAKFLANPFSLQSDYSLNFNLLGFLATLKWYALRAFMIPEGIRNFPAWMIILSLIPGLILILMFRQKLARGLGIYLLGVLPVLAFSGHLLAAYAIFGTALMVIELGKKSVIPAKAGIYPGSGPGQVIDRFRVPPSLAVRLQELFVHGSRSAIRRAGKPGMTMFLATAIVWLAAAGFVYSNHLNHWSTGRGLVSARLTKNYTEADSNGKKQILAASADFASNAETYFSSMAGRQFGVLDRGVNKGIFGWLFYRGNDLTSQFLPDAEFFKDSILAGKFPVWNPWIFAGMPYFLDPQNFLWYPPNYIFLLVPVETGFLLLLVGHLVMAGWGVKKVLGELGISGRSGLLGVGMFVLAPKLVGHIEEGNWTLVIAACWLPILYLALKKSKFWWIVISLSVIIINNLNIGYYSTIFLTLYFLLKSHPDRLLISVKVLVKIWLLVVFLTVPRWLPLVMFGGQTLRADLQEPPLPLWSWTKIAKSLVLPLGSGHPQLQNEEILYLGIIPILVILLGILGKLGAVIRKGDSLFWLIWLPFIFFVALNNKTPFFYLINWLPGFSLLRITTRPWIFAALALALAVPMAIRIIGEIRDIRGIRVRGKIIKAAVLSVAGLIMVEFGWFDWEIFARRGVAADPVPARFYRQMAAEGVMARAYCTTGCLDRLTAQRMGIALLGGNNPIQLKSFVEYLRQAGGYREQGYHPILPPYTVFNQRPQPKAELLAKTATKFVVSPYELTGENFELIDHEGSFSLYQNMVEMSEVKDHYFELADLDIVN